MERERGETGGRERNREREREMGGGLGASTSDAITISAAASPSDAVSGLLFRSKGYASPSPPDIRG